VALRARSDGQDRWISDGGGRGSGRLLARIQQGTVSFYFGYKHEGSARKLPLGPYDEAGKLGLTLPQARDRVAELSRVYRGGITDLHTHVERVLAADQAALAVAEQAAARELQLAREGSLKHLLDSYVKHLAAQSKSTSAKDARNVFKHVPAALLQRRAAALGMGDFVPVVGALVEAGKGRTAGKLRSYMRAAYEMALATKADPTAPAASRVFGVEYNPVATVSTRGLSQYNRARTRALNAAELGAYLTRIEAMPESPKRDALLLSLYLGGQRLRQLLRLEVPHVDLSGKTLTLFDSKGRRALPRVHVLPLVPQALGVVRRLVSAERADGERRVWGQLYYTTLSHTVEKISDAMLAAKEAREPFQARDIRRTCETALAGLKISKDIRGQIQSHGLGGVQAKHYDMHSYMDEKRHALLKLAKHLEQLKAAHIAQKRAEAT
jgi:integrase